LVQDGRGVERDADRAVALYRQACDGGLGVGCSNLGMMYESGTGGARIDPAKAKAAFAEALVAYRASCAGPTPTYCANLGWMLESGRGGAANGEEALAVWQRGCDGGDADACVNRWLHDLELGGDVSRVISGLREQCAAEAPSSCGPLARALAPTEPEAASGFAARGCEQGDAVACGVLAVLLRAGDAAGSSAAWERACRLGLAEGCRAVVDEQVGRGSLSSPAGRDAIVEHLRQACHIGDARSCAVLASGSSGTELGRPDPTRATVYWGEACRLGLPDACVELLRTGQDLPLDGEVRARFLGDACGQGVAEACGVTPPAR
ncbi:MAG: tetratricopeptide repeat protein, partial [Myxococcota bacterium]